MTEFNWVDYIILAIFVISIIAGLLRGVIREVIALLTWIAAFVVASMFSGKLASAFTGSHSIVSEGGVAGVAASQVSMLSLSTSFMALFIATLLAGSLINYLATATVEMRGPSFTNRLLGGVFGLLRGTVIVLIAIFLLALTPIASQAAWQASQFVNSFQPVIKWMKDEAQPLLNEVKDKVGKSVENINPQQMIDGAQKMYQGVGKSSDNE